MSEKNVDTTVDPAKHSKGEDADNTQTGAERDEAIEEFDDHMDGAGDKPKLPTPDAEDVTADTSDPKTITRSE